MERDSVVFDEQKLGPLSMCQPPQAPADPADTVELDLDSMGEKVTVPMAQSGTAVQNLNPGQFEIPDDLPPLPAMNEEELAELLDFYNPGEGSGGEDFGYGGDDLQTADEAISADSGPMALETADEEPEEALNPPSPIQEDAIQDVRRSVRDRRKPEFLTYMATLTVDPTTLEEVKKRSNWPSWKAAMDVELKALQELGTFIPTKLPPGREAIPCK